MKKPDFVDVSASGDMGYTYGEFTYSYTDSTGNTVENRGISYGMEKTGRWFLAFCVGLIQERLLKFSDPDVSPLNLNAATGMYLEGNTSCCLANHLVIQGNHKLPV